MLASLLLPLLAATALNDPILLDGRCDYPVEMGAAATTDHRVSCDSVVITQGRNDADILVQFAEKRGHSLIGFAGPVDGHMMTIRRIYLKPNSASPATGGHCKIFYREEIATGVTCVGKLGAENYVANFRAFAP